MCCPTTRPRPNTWTTAQGTRVWKSAKGAGRQLMVVCTPCNNVWMAGREEEAKPLLVPMINGRKVAALDRSQQRTLAAWAFKTAVIGEQLHPSTANIPKEQPHWLGEQGEPPRATKVFTSATDARWPGDTHYHEQKLMLPDGGVLPSVFNGYVATLLIRHLALQVVGSVFDDAEFTYQAPLDSAVARIWPFVRTRRWPPGPVLAPAAAGALADHWRGAMPPNPPF